MSDPRRQRQRRQARRGQLAPGHALTQRIGLSPREITFLAAGAMARLSLVQQGADLRCRRADPPLRRWLAAAARPDGRPTGLVVVAFTCRKCEGELTVSDDPDQEGAA